LFTQNVELNELDVITCYVNYFITSLNDAKTIVFKEIMIMKHNAINELGKLNHVIELHEPLHTWKLCVMEG